MSVVFLFRRGCAVNDDPAISLRDDLLVLSSVVSSCAGGHTLWVKGVIILYFIVSLYCGLARGLVSGCPAWYCVMRNLLLHPKSPFQQQNPLPLAG